MRLNGEATRWRRGAAIRGGALAGIALVVLVVALSLLTDTPRRQPVRYVCPCAVVASRDGRTLYVAGHTAYQVVVIERAGRRVKATIALSHCPSGLALSPAGTALFVTAGGPDGRVFVVDTASRKVVTTIPVGHTPLSPVVTGDGLTLFVCNRFNNSISVVDAYSGTETGRIPVVREPVAAAMTPDDRYMLVANHLPVGLSTFLTAAPACGGSASARTAGMRMSRTS